MKSALGLAPGNPIGVNFEPDVTSRDVTQQQFVSCGSLLVFCIVNNQDEGKLTRNVAENMQGTENQRCVYDQAYDLQFLSIKSAISFSSARRERFTYAVAFLSVVRLLSIRSEGLGYPAGSIGVQRPKVC